MLKSHRNNISLWRHYATVEWTLGNQDKASSIFSTILSLLTSHEEKLALWEAWTESSFFDGRENVLNIVAGMVEGKPVIEVNGGILLKVRNVSPSQTRVLI